MLKAVFLSSRSAFLASSLFAASFLASCGQDSSQTHDFEIERQPVGNVPLTRRDGAFDHQSFLVLFAENTTKKERSTVIESVGGQLQDANDDGVDDRLRFILNGRMAKVTSKARNGDATWVSTAVNTLARRPGVVIAEPNYRVDILRTPNDSFFDELWGLSNTGERNGCIAGADIGARFAWDRTNGSSDIVVGVIDTGIDYNHGDLIDNLWTNPGEIAGNNVDDDDNGVTDDIYGYNTIDGSGDPMDEIGLGHGTHVAGTIGATGNNGYGAVGVNWRVKMMALKFFDAAGNGGYISQAIAAIDYAMVMKLYYGVNLRVLSNSWGGGAYSEALAYAISDANDADILFVAAAGNDSSNNDILPMFPANYKLPNVMSIAATTCADRLADFSNYGARTVHLAAPGVDIWSTYVGGGLELMSGTSMATPHVSGAAALLLSYFPDMTTSELKARLMDSGTPVPALKSKTISGKRLNLAGVFGDPQPPVTVDLASGGQTTAEGTVTLARQGAFAAMAFITQSRFDSTRGVSTRVPLPVAGWSPLIEPRASNWDRLTRSYKCTFSNAQSIWIHPPEPVLGYPNGSIEVRPGRVTTVPQGSICKWVVVPL